MLGLFMLESERMDVIIFRHKETAPLENFCYSSTEADFCPIVWKWVLGQAGLFAVANNKEKFILFHPAQLFAGSLFDGFL